MKFDHMVKFNGVYYNTGEDVPIDSKETKVEKDSVVSPSFHLYSKSELDGMTVKEMRQLAEERGFSLPTGVSKAETINAFLNQQ